MKEINRNLFKIFILSLAISITKAAEKLITIPQRPILIIHGLTSSCKDKFYQNRVRLYGFICLEYGGHQKTLRTYKEQSKDGCTELNRVYNENPHKFRNGFYVYTLSHGGIIVRTMLEFCPLFARLTKRIIAEGAPNMGFRTDQTKFSETIKGIYHQAAHFPTMFLYYISHSIYDPDGDILSLDQSVKNNFVKELAYRAHQLNEATIKKLELYVNVANDMDGLVPLSSTFFGAEYNPKLNKIKPFYLSVAYRKKYLGLNVLYDSGRYFNCLAHGAHAIIKSEEEIRNLLMFLDDNCVFDPIYFRDVPESELYGVCLKLKLLYNKKMKSLNCDPSPNELYINYQFMKSIRKYKLEPNYVSD